MTLTREELLRGVAKVNNERIEREDPKVRDDSEVSGDGDERGDTPARGRGTHAPPKAGNVPPPKESLHEFVARRADEVVAEVEALTEEIKEHEESVSTLSARRGELSAELKQLRKLREKESP